jgi:hypothetical protein
VSFRPSPRGIRKSHSLRVLPRSRHVDSAVADCFLLTVSSKSLLLNSFVGHCLLNPVLSYRYENMVGRGRKPVQRADARVARLNPFKCAVTDKHRVLPVFSRNRQVSNPLDATLMRIPVTVDSKRLTEKLSPLDATLTKNTGGRRWPRLRAPHFQAALRLGASVAILWSHCDARALVPQSANVPDFFTIRGNNSAPPGV